MSVSAVLERSVFTQNTAVAAPPDIEKDTRSYLRSVFPSDAVNRISYPVERATAPISVSELISTFTGKSVRSESTFVLLIVIFLRLS